MSIPRPLASAFMVSVMPRLPDLLRQFRDDQRGAFAIMFGVIAVVLIAMGGAVVDYVSLEQARNRAQIALDAAALALQHRIFEEPVNTASIQAQAQALLTQRMSEGRGQAVIENTLVDVANGSLQFRAHMNISTIFVSLVGVEEMGAAVVSEATRKQSALEVVMVLDNSGSMDQQNRITYLRAAANCAANTLFYTDVVDSQIVNNISRSCEPAPGAETVKDVKVGIVPFTMTVNVGTNNRNAAWIDQDGLSSVAANNFDDDQNEDTPFRGPVNRLALFDGLRNEDWRGCVETRPHKSTGPDSNLYLDTDDTPPTRSDADTLFVPFFSPDLPDKWGGQDYANDFPLACTRAGTCTRTARYNQCDRNYEKCDDDSSPWTVEGTGGSCSCTDRTLQASAWTTTTNDGRGRWRQESCTPYNPALSSLELHEQLCKYDGASVKTSFSEGPNADCTEIAIQPLTDDPETVTDTIADMKPLGGTNIHEGAAWGFRVLSPTEPFVEGVDYDVANNSKVMILMTDGENTAYDLDGYADARVRPLNGSSLYSAYGWPRNRRLGNMSSSNEDLVKEMNARTLQTCANAKAEGITIYTIGLATDKVTQSTPQTVRRMLTDCASTSGNAYFPANPSELKDVFKSIADDLAALRLAL